MTWQQQCLCKQVMQTQSSATYSLALNQVLNHVQKGKPVSPLLSAQGPGQAILQQGLHL